MFCTTVLVSSKKSAQLYEEEIHFGILLLNRNRNHLTTVTLTSDAVTQHQYDFSASKDGCVDQV